MKPDVQISHEFVEFIPEQLAENTIYVSIKYATAAHKCPCGCGKEVVTPLSPTDWTLIFDGQTVSLDPSIGNWNFPCRSHYWIIENRATWSRSWSQHEIDAGRADDRAAKEIYFSGQTPKHTDGQGVRPNRRSLRSRLRQKAKD